MDGSRLTSVGFDFYILRSIVCFRLSSVCQRAEEDSPRAQSQPGGRVRACSSLAEITSPKRISFCQDCHLSYNVSTDDKGLIINQLANFEIHLVKLGNAQPDESAVATRLKQLFDKVIQQGHVTAYQEAHIQWPQSCPASLPSDQLLVYVLPDSNDSVVHAHFKPRDFAEGGGYTTWDGTVTSSEVYVSGCEGNGVGVANMIFHEAMHNKGHWPDRQLHGPFGGHGLASAEIGKDTELNAVNVQLMAGVLGARNPQWLGGCIYFYDPNRLTHVACAETVVLPGRSHGYRVQGIGGASRGPGNRLGPVGLG